VVGNVNFLLDVEPARGIGNLLYLIIVIKIKILALNELSYDSSYC